MKTFLVCALEPSANLHLKEVLKAYKKTLENLNFMGFMMRICAKNLIYILNHFIAHMSLVLWVL
ncbi:hypothetical protein THJ013_06440 [Campylobacter jejuni]|nr:hypothetical protein THJ013_06440 [Campylobacter jejuni]GKY09203.1 hypothetical protein THJ042_08460 [Campylobacter jejuni]GML84711.1 hypothetical protein B11728_08570 [Campylobacter jejuni]